MIRKFALILMVAFIGNGCDGQLFSKAFLASSQAKAGDQVITVAAVDGALSYQRRGQFAKGFEYDILSSFALETGYRLQVKTFKTTAEAIQSTEMGESQALIARLPDTGFSKYLLPGPAYERQNLQLICPQKMVFTNHWSSLNAHAGSSVVIAEKNITQLMRERWSKVFPEINLIVLPLESNKNPLALIKKQKANCALMNANEFLRERRFYSGLDVKTSIRTSSTYHIWLAPNETALQQEMSLWFQRMARRGEMNDIRSRYFSYLDEVRPIDLLYFERALRTRLPKYRKHFIRSGRQFNLPWKWIAAVSYQESKWNPNAVSFTGVRGLMQLTHDTAAVVGIQDRRDPQQSVHGGAKYLHYLYRKQPQFLPVRERWILTLIAYNVGVAHLWDAQNLAVQMGKNPYAWEDLKNVLPLLAHPDYQSQLRYGYARGEEPVGYVRRVLSYMDLLEKI